MARPELTVDLIWKALLALVGCFAAGYVGVEVLGGEALGWIAGGAILAATCFPLFRRLFELRGLR